MQVVENTCIGHEIGLGKISEPLALKALDFTINSTTTRNAVVEARCGMYRARGGSSGTLGFQPPHLRELSRAYPDNRVMCR